MIWVPRDLDILEIEDDDHRRFLHDLERGESRKNTCDFVRASPVELTRLITDKLERLRTTAGARHRPASTSCLLVTHDEDTVHMLPVAGALLERGVHPYINQEANEPQETMKIFEKRLREVAGLIVFYGNVSAGWVRERLDTAIQRAVADGRLDLKLGVYAPPEKRPELTQFSRGFIRVEALSSAADALSFVGAP